MATAFRGNLAALGYSPGSAAQQLRMLAQLSGWMTGQGLVVQQLSTVVIEEFFRSRRRSHTNLRTARSLDPFLAFLDREGTARSQVAAIEFPARGPVLDQFGHYLSGERGLAATTVENYLNQARPFLRWRAGRTDAPLSAVSIDEVTGFLVHPGAGRTPLRHLDRDLHPRQFRFHEHLAAQGTRPGA